jgi:hypothetical protein
LPEEMKNLIFKPEKEVAVLRFALSCSHRIWKACWEINRALEISLAVHAPPLSSENSLPARQETQMDQDLTKSPEELVYSFQHPWREYRLMTISMAGIKMKGFHYLLEIESEKADGLPDPESILSALKTCNAFSAVICIQ